MALKHRMVNSLVRQYFSRYSPPEKVAKIILGTPEVAPVVVVPASEGILTLLSKSFRGIRKQRGKVTFIKTSLFSVSLCCTGVGAPSTEIILTALLAAGARYVIRADVCGALDETLNVGDLFLATEAIGYDGVSSVYLPDKDCYAADSQLCHWLADSEREEKVTIRKGTIATVDFFFAQRDSHLKAWAEKSQAVDMETAAIYAMCRCLGVPALSLMAISDVKTRGIDPFIQSDFPYSELKSSLKRLGSVVSNLVGRVYMHSHVSVEE